MARGKCTFKMRDLTAAVKAVRAAGVEVARVEIDRQGKIVVLVGNAAESVVSENEWDSIR